MNALQYSQINAFISPRDDGNPAAVILLDRDYDDNILQQVARRLGLAETAFLQLLESTSEPVYRLRWFTPSVEFPLCGHATLAASFFLFPFLPISTSSISFETMSGRLSARKWGDGIELDFPADLPILAASDLADCQVDILKRSVEEASPGLEIIDIRKGRLAWIVQVTSRVNLRGLAIDATAFRDSTDGIMVILTQTAPLDDTAEIYSRVFDPVELEDPVTGSAHCILAPYWLSCARLDRRNRSPTSTLIARQVSAEGGELELVWSGGNRVLLRGRAKMVKIDTIQLK